MSRLLLAALKTTLLSLAGEAMFRRLSVTIIVTLLQIVRDGCVWMQKKDVIKLSNADDRVLIALIDILDGMVEQLKEGPPAP